MIPAKYVGKLQRIKPDKLDIRTKLQDIMDDGGDAPSIAVITVLIHPKKRLRDLKLKKRKAEDIVARMTARTHTEVAGTSVFEIKRDHCRWL